MNIYSRNLQKKRNFKTKTVFKAFLLIIFFICFVLPAQAYQFSTYEANSIPMADISDGKDYISNQSAWLYWNFTLDPEALYANSDDLDQLFLQNSIWCFEDKADVYNGNNFINMANFSITSGLNAWSNISRIQAINQPSHLITANSVPESTTILILGLGLFMLASISKKKLKMNY